MKKLEVMNSKSKHIEINPEYEDLFSFNTTDEKHKHNAEMISFRILSEIEKLCEEKDINRTELAKMINTSKSYVTQLFRGSKQVNTLLLGKLEEILDVSFEVKIKPNEDSKENFITKRIQAEYIHLKRRLLHDNFLYVATNNNRHDKTKEFMNKIHTENTLKQKAG